MCPCHIQAKYKAAKSYSRFRVSCSDCTLHTAIQHVITVLEFQYCNHPELLCIYTTLLV